jgi:hypothetical protein
MASAGGKCPVCTKSVYPNDPKLTVDGLVWHKGCFKCSVCSTQLVLRTAQVVAGVIYCEKDKPRDKPSQSADRMDMNNVKAAPKVVCFIS